MDNSNSTSSTTLAASGEPQLHQWTAKACGKRYSTGPATPWSSTVAWSWSSVGDNVGSSVGCSVVIHYDAATDAATDIASDGGSRRQGAHLGAPRRARARTWARHGTPRRALERAMARQDAHLGALRRARACTWARSGAPGRVLGRATARTCATATLQGAHPGSWRSCGRRTAVLIRGAGTPSPSPRRLLQTHGPLPGSRAAWSSPVQ